MVSCPKTNSAIKCTKTFCFRYVHPSNGSVISHSVQGISVPSSLVTPRQPMTIINYVVKSIIISSLFVAWCENYSVTERWKISRILVRVWGEISEWYEMWCINSGDDRCFGDVNSFEYYEDLAWSVSKWLGWCQSLLALIEGIVPSVTAWKNTWYTAIFRQ